MSDGIVKLLIDGVANTGVALDATGEPVTSDVRAFPDESTRAVESEVSYKVFKRIVVPELIAAIPELPADCVADSGGFGGEKLEL